MKPSNETESVRLDQTDWRARVLLVVVVVADLFETSGRQQQFQSVCIQTSTKQHHIDLLMTRNYNNMTSSAATSTQDRLLAAPTIRQSTPSTSSLVPHFKSLALMIATQTYIMLPNLNQYLFFSSQKAAAATTTTTTTHSHQTSGLTSIVLDRRWQTGGDEQDQDEDNESENIETTSEVSTQINRSDELQEEDINHDTSNDNDLNNNNNDIADDTQRREQERLERFRKLGAQLRAISDEFARSRR